jgi:Tfp pilus assembly protein PilV
MTRLRFSDVRGFAMIEAIAAATLLVIVALGVLRGLDVAQRSSGREKARSTAAALTEKDQERLRSFRAVDLANLDESNPVTVNGVKYVVESRVDWVRDSTGGTQSCTNSAVQADYMRITSTTTSGLINTPIPPIKMSSLVAPPIGAFGANQGSLGIQVNNAAGQGVAGQNVTITGPTTITNATNEVGCAIFAYVPVGAYTASVNTPGWVDRGGNQLATVGATVNQGVVNVKTMVYDRAATVVANFDTEDRNGATSSIVPPPSTTQLSASNPGVPTGPFSSAAGARFFDPAPVGAPAYSSITMSGLFPFTDGYSLYGGGCRGADPTANDSDYYTTAGTAATVDVLPGQTTSPAATVRLPSLNLRILYNGAPLPAANRPTTRVVIRQTGTACSERFIAAAPATDDNGWLKDQAYPFNTYSICVESTTPASSPSTQLRNKTITGVRNWYHRGMKLPDVASPVIDLAPNSTTSSGACTL